MSDDFTALVAAGVPAKYAPRVLSLVGTGRALGTLTARELVGAGVPEKTATRVAGAIALGYRLSDRGPIRAINQPLDAWSLLSSRCAGLAQEVFWMIPVDIRNGVIGGPDGVVEVARGSVCSVEVHPREVFRAAVRCAAAGVVIAHNHPSGDPTPSPEDITLTRRLKECGTLLGIPVIDHIIITPNAFRSLAEVMGDA